MVIHMSSFLCYTCCGDPFSGEEPFCVDGMNADHGPSDGDIVVCNQCGTSQTVSKGQLIPLDLSELDEHQRNLLLAVKELVNARDSKDLPN
jgi:hypothetical protein